MQWRCEEAKLEGSISMKQQEGPAPLYAAPWNAKVSCGPPKPAAGTHVIMLQVCVYYSTLETLKALVKGSACVLCNAPLHFAPMER